MIDRQRGRIVGFLAGSVFILLLGISTDGKAQPAASTPSDGNSGAERTAWFQQAKFGMFIHWGPYSARQRGGFLAHHGTGGALEHHRS